MEEFIRNKWPHFIYGLLVGGMLCFYAYKQAQWSAFTEAAAQQMQICNRIMENDFRFQYVQLDRTQQDFPSFYMKLWIKQLDSLLEEVDSLKNTPLALADFSARKNAMPAQDSSLQQAVNSLFSPISAPDEQGKLLEEALFNSKKASARSLLTLQYAQKMAICGNFRYDPFKIDIGCPKTCCIEGDTILLELGMIPTTILTEKCFSNIQYYINDMPLTSHGLEASYPLVFKKSGRQSIRFTAKTTDLLTGRVQHFIREMEWCVAPH